MKWTLHWQRNLRVCVSSYRHLRLQDRKVWLIPLLLEPTQADLWYHVHVHCARPWIVSFKHKQIGKTMQKHVHTFMAVDIGTSWIKITIVSQLQLQKHHILLTKNGYVVTPVLIMSQTTTEMNFWLERSRNSSRAKKLNIIQL